MKCHCENLALGSTGSIHVARMARLNFILRLFILRLIGDAFVKKECGVLVMFLQKASLISSIIG